MKKQFLLSFLILLILIAITSSVVLYANGYRFNTANGKPSLDKTGILNVASLPKGAQVYINGNLTSATNNAINLAPGKYTVTMSKDGYNNWQKDMLVQEQIVANADATLFPSAPTLQSISTVGVFSPLIDPSGTKLAFKIASQSAKRNGIYVLDMTNRIFPVLALQSSSTQLADDTEADFSTARISWSPDGLQIMASIPSKISTTSATTYLLQANTFNETPKNVTATLPTVISEWDQKLSEKEKALYDSYPQAVQRIITEHMRILAVSPDDTKLLYMASTSAELPLILSPRRIGNNLLYENRSLKKDSIYVYDIREDVNTKILDIAPQEPCMKGELDCLYPLTFMPDSKHLLYMNDRKISIVETDGSNMTLIYAGPFIEPYVYAWPDGSKIVIITNLNNLTIPPTLYTIGIR